MGESNEAKKTALAQASEEAMVADTMGGRMHVRWDESAQATPHGQLVFFAEFLATAGVFDRRIDGCPLRYSSPNASRTRDVLGTLMLGILAGSKRYAHIAGIRGDGVAAQALGLRGLVSEDSIRRALKAMDPAASEPWMRTALMASVRDALDRPWVMDIDATIKPLYGHQEGAELGYNPHKPGRPSQGWQAIEDSIKRSGWSKARRVVVLRRRIKRDVALTQTSKRDDKQLVLALPHDELQDNAQLCEYTVLVTNVEYDLWAIGQLYRDRCDCENGFDELKNQWGWGGFNTHDMHRSQITARAVALVYNWWSWYVRAANPKARREALTSRPLLLAAVGRAVNHSGQTTLYLTPMHAETGLIKSMVANVQAAISHVRRAAQQLPKIDRWATLLAYICRRIVAQSALPTPPPALAAPG